MRLIIALGNPGAKYELTRHNVGFIYADNLANKYSCSFKTEGKFKAEIAKCSINNEQVLIVKPQTYMNLSGDSVRELLRFYKLDNSDIFVVYDDISMNLGGLRFRASGSDGGHNGIKSIISNVNSNTFDRLKIGIGPQPKFLPSETFVLQNFSKEELSELESIIKKAIDATELYLSDGLQKAQNNYNTK